MTLGYFVILIAFLFFVYQGEHVILKHSLHDCETEQESDIELLNRDVCSSSYDRERFRGTVDCEGAERRLRLNKYLCALNKWVSRSKITEFFQMLFGSYFHVLGFVLPLSYIALSFWNKRHKDEEVLLRLRDR